ncbi:response regulator [Terriglobus albidus]|uniref:Response regulator n=1 Tax=Terriglobus albidus TaxID=1592106 RepID=A0A5B9E7U0_9BACT|nr:response regulator [Terriglobus albidus]QEE27624.1 response regulator [Terriglobus albidus]
MNSQFPHRTILLVDDDSDIRSLYKAFLRHAGYAVLSCHNAHRAAEVFASRPNVDLLLTDIHMPEGSGVELAQTLTAAKPEMPVILISGEDLGQSRAAEILSRSWRFVQKPVSLPYLLDLIHTLLTPSLSLRGHNPGLPIPA